jgi:paraquat-inducible protein B
MTDQAAPSKADVSTANVKRKSRGFSPVWVIPIIAALVGGWMHSHGISRLFNVINFSECEL